MVVRSISPYSIIGSIMDQQREQSTCTSTRVLNKANTIPLHKQDGNSDNSLSSRCLPAMDDNTCFAFRRCSLEHAKQNSARKLDATCDVEESHRANVRRSSMKNGSTSTTSSASRAKSGVTFSMKAKVRPIPAKSYEDISASWLSKEERHQIQLRCNADLKILKRIKKSPATAKNDPELQAVRSTVSIRGLEQFSSKRLHRALWALQQDHIYAVLEAQDIQRDMQRSYGVLPDPEDVAKISFERSAEARERALRQGLEDEAAVSIRRRPSSTAVSDQHTSLRRQFASSNRRVSMPRPPTKTNAQVITATARQKKHTGITLDPSCARGARVSSSQTSQGKLATCRENRCSFNDL